MGKKLVGIAVIVIMLLSVFVFMGCTYEAHEKGIKRIENIIDISLPVDIEVKHHNFDRSFDGSYTQFTVLKFQESPDDFLSKYPLVQVDELWGYDYFVRSVKGQNIKEKHIPSFDELLMSDRTKFSSAQGFTTVYFPSTLELAFFIVHVG